jgi:hypothetical protein
VRLLLSLSLKLLIERIIIVVALLLLFFPFQLPIPRPFSLFACSTKFDRKAKRPVTPTKKEMSAIARYAGFVASKTALKRQFAVVAAAPARGGSCARYDVIFVLRAEVHLHRESPPLVIEFEFFEIFSRVLVFRIGKEWREKTKEPARLFFVLLPKRRKRFFLSRGRFGKRRKVSSPVRACVSLFARLRVRWCLSLLFRY